MSITAEITRIKSNIANAYTKAEQRGATLPTVQNSENLAETIRNIPQTSDWQPEPDWWDIDTILENDTEDYPAKMIVLLSNGLDTMNFTMNTTNKIAKIKTSDGMEYTKTSTHTWDKIKDKECSLGYKTRYYIIYFSSEVSTFEYDMTSIPTNFSNLYIIIKNLEVQAQAGSARTWFSHHHLLESVKLINSKIIDRNSYLFYQDCSLKEIDFNRVYINGSYAFSYCFSITNFDGLNFIDFTSLENSFSNLGPYVKIPIFDSSNIKNFIQAFSGSMGIREIESIDFNSATNVVNCFYNCKSLQNINQISNIKISGLSFSSCILLNHDTLIRILNALHDHSTDTENVHTIIFGATNLTKLTDEEMAIGQNKGWTIS